MQNDTARLTLKTGRLISLNLASIMTHTETVGLQLAHCWHTVGTLPLANKPRSAARLESAD